MKTKAHKKEGADHTIVVSGSKSDIEKIGELAKKTERSRSGVIRLMLKHCLSCKSFLDSI